MVARAPRSRATSRSARPRTSPTFLKIGALPVKLALISQSTVSATLGQQALDQAELAGAIGLLVVVLFLLLYYRLLGAVAVLGLVVYGVFFYALILLIPITLTLPGMAGLILTIGVAADANIVIFERIKEEARAGRSMLSAIAQGYRKGIATIVDANVITLFTAFILFVLATAGVKGFAFTLGIGTIVSLFTAVLFTQAVLGSLGPIVDPALAARPGSRVPPCQVALRLQRRKPLVLLDLGHHPDDRGDLARRQAAQPRDRLHVRRQGDGELPEARHGRSGPQHPGIGQDRQRIERRDPVGRQPEARPERGRDPGQASQEGGERPGQAGARRRLRPARGRAGLPEHHRWPDLRRPGRAAAP